MLNQETFYFATTKKIIAAFGTIFNEIKVPRFDKTGTLAELIKVPINYASREKVLGRLYGDTDIDRKPAITLPRISFELTSEIYDATRKLNPIKNIRPVKSNDGKYSKQLVATPYNFHFTLWVYAKYMEDGLKIKEQIVPFFNPEFPLTLNMIPEMGIVHDVPVILNQCTLEDDDANGDFDQRRHVIHTFDFTAKGYHYGPIREQAIIKFANVSIYSPDTLSIDDAVGKVNPIDRVTVQPGLTANGEPTTNIDETIPYQEIEADDPYGFITTIYGDLSSST